MLTAPTDVPHFLNTLLLQVPEMQLMQKLNQSNAIQLRSELHKYLISDINVCYVLTCFNNFAGSRVATTVHTNFF